jgi:tetratricopeptide (TPR) repeat protein
LIVTRNAFRDTLVGLAYDSDTYIPDIFSRACVESFEQCEWEQFGYSFTQVFEPAVLYEIALLDDVPLTRLARLEQPGTPAMTWLRSMIDNAAAHTVVELINLASCLVTISRFDLVRDILAALAERPSTPREDFEVGWLEFMVANRCDGGTGSTAAFERMRAAVMARAVPASRALDASTQAVVWYVKRKELPAASYEWWRALGTKLVEASTRVDPGAVSSWYRGVAMVPAADGDAATTRDYMERARAAAEVDAGSGGAAELNAIKTYHESSIKEHMYVRRDLAAAEESGRALIELDPAWSVSYGELAEVHVRAGRPLRAAELYEQAVVAGPPYVAYHLLKAAACREKGDDLTAALAHFEELAAFAPRSKQVMSGGLALARRLAHPSTTAFERGLAQIEHHVAG